MNYPLLKILNWWICIACCRLNEAVDGGKLAAPIHVWFEKCSTTSRWLEMWYFILVIVSQIKDSALDFLCIFLFASTDLVSFFLYPK